MNLPPTLRKLARRGVTFSRALLKDGNLLSRPQHEAVLAPVSYRSSRRRRRRKRLLLKVPISNQKIKRCSHIRPTYQSRHHKTVTKKTAKDDQREKQRGKNVKGRTDVICR